MRQSKCSISQYERRFNGMILQKAKQLMKLLIGRFYSKLFSQKDFQKQKKTHTLVVLLRDSQHQQVAIIYPAWFKYICLIHDSFNILFDNYRKGNNFITMNL